MDPGFQKLSHGNDGHSVFLQSVAPLAQRRPWRRPWNAREVMLVGAAAHPLVGRTILAAQRPSGPGSSGPGVGLAVDGAQSFLADVGVHLRGGQAGMARGAPGRPAGRPRRRGGGWRRCGAGRAGGSARRSGGRGCAGRPGGPRRAPRRFTKAASDGPSMSSRPSSNQARQAATAASWTGTRRCLLPLPSTVTVRPAQVDVAAVEAAELRDRAARRRRGARGRPRRGGRRRSRSARRAARTSPLHRTRGRRRRPDGARRERAGSASR